VFDSNALVILNSFQNLIKRLKREWCNEHVNGRFDSYVRFSLMKKNQKIKKEISYPRAKTRARPHFFQAYARSE